MAHFLKINMRAEFVTQLAEACSSNLVIGKKSHRTCFAVNR